MNWSPSPDNYRRNVTDATAWADAHSGLVQFIFDERPRPLTSDRWLATAIRWLMLPAPDPDIAPSDSQRRAKQFLATTG